MINGLMWICGRQIVDNYLCVIWMLLMTRPYRKSLYVGMNRWGWFIFIKWDHISLPPCGTLWRNCGIKIPWKLCRLSGKCDKFPTTSEKTFETQNAQKQPLCHLKLVVNGGKLLRNNIVNCSWEKSFSSKSLHLVQLIFNNSKFLMIFLAIFMFNGTAV